MSDDTEVNTGSPGKSAKGNASSTNGDAPAKGGGKNSKSPPSRPRFSSPQGSPKAENLQSPKGSGKDGAKSSGKENTKGGGKDINAKGSEKGGNEKGNEKGSGKGGRRRSQEKAGGRSTAGGGSSVLDLTAGLTSGATSAVYDFFGTLSRGADTIAGAVVDTISPGDSPPGGGGKSSRKRFSSSNPPSPIPGVLGGLSGNVVNKLRAKEAAAKANVAGKAKGEGKAIKKTKDSKSAAEPVLSDASSSRGRKAKAKGSPGKAKGSPAKAKQQQPPTGKGDGIFTPNDSESHDGIFTPNESGQESEAGKQVSERSIDNVEISVSPGGSATKSALEPVPESPSGSSPGSPVESPPAALNTSDNSKVPKKRKKRRSWNSSDAAWGSEFTDSNQESSEDEDGPNAYISDAAVSRRSESMPTSSIHPADGNDDITSLLEGGFVGEGGEVGDQNKSADSMPPPPVWPAAPQETVVFGRPANEPKYPEEKKPESPRGMWGALFSTPNRFNGGVTSSSASPTLGRRKNSGSSAKSSGSAKSSAGKASGKSAKSSAAGSSGDPKKRRPSDPKVRERWGKVRKSVEESDPGIFGGIMRTFNPFDSSVVDASGTLSSAKAKARAKSSQAKSNQSQSPGTRKKGESGAQQGGDGGKEGGKDGKERGGKERSGKDKATSSAKTSASSSSSSSSSSSKRQSGTNNDPSTSKGPGGAEEKRPVHYEKKESWNISKNHNDGYHALNPLFWLPATLKVSTAAAGAGLMSLGYAWGKTQSFLTRSPLCECSAMKASLGGWLLLNGFSTDVVCPKFIRKTPNSEWWSRRKAELRTMMKDGSFYDRGLPPTPAVASPAVGSPAVGSLGSGVEAKGSGVVEGVEGKQAVTSEIGKPKGDESGGKVAEGKSGEGKEDENKAEDSEMPPEAGTPSVDDTATPRKDDAETPSTTVSTNAKSAGDSNTPGPASESPTAALSILDRLPTESSEPPEPSPDEDSNITSDVNSASAAKGKVTVGAEQGADLTADLTADSDSAIKPPPEELVPNPQEGQEAASSSSSSSSSSSPTAPEKNTINPTTPPKQLPNNAGSSSSSSSSSSSTANNNSNNPVPQTKSKKAVDFAPAPRTLGQFPGSHPRPLSKKDPSIQTTVGQCPFLVCNHVSYVDGVVMMHELDYPKIVAKSSVRNWPIVGEFMENAGCVFVDRGDAKSKNAVIDAIANHGLSWRPGDKPLLIYPEGTTSNGQTISRFLRGVFMPGMPVLRCYIQYTGSWNAASPNFKEVVKERKKTLETYDGSEWLGNYFGTLVHRVRITLGEPYYPSLEERADPNLYAKNVETVMRQELEEMQRIERKK